MYIENRYLSRKNIYLLIDGFAVRPQCTELLRHFIGEKVLYCLTMSELYRILYSRVELYVMKLM
jgi:hypothetical protein